MTKTIRIREIDAAWIQVVSEAKGVTVSQLFSDILTHYWRSVDRQELRVLIEKMMQEKQDAIEGVESLDL